MRQEILDNNYLHVPNFISKEAAATLAAEYEKFAVENKLPGDDQAPYSNSCYNYVGFTELLCNKVSHMADLVGENVFPTYCYGRVYRPGDDLKPHKDRDACEVSVTLNLSMEKEWPIYIRKPNGEVACLNLSPGDAMLYLGCDAEHWRDPLQEGKHIQVFLHYVRSRGPRAKCLFDARENKPNVSILNGENLSQETKDKFPQDLSKYIQYWPNFLHHSFIDTLMAEFTKDESEWQDTRIGGGENGGVVDKNIRGAMTILLSQNETIEKNLWLRKQIDSYLYETTKQILAKYVESFPLAKPVADSGYELLRYEEGTGYTQHTDHFHENPRILSCSIGLTDPSEFEGGEFTFFDQAISFKQEKGSVLVFPSSFQYPHQVNTVTKGTRYSIITWFA